MGAGSATSVLNTRLPGARGRQPLRRRHELLPEHRRGQPGADGDGERAAGRRPHRGTHRRPGRPVGAGACLRPPTASATSSSSAAASPASRARSGWPSRTTSTSRCSTATTTTSSSRCSTRWRPASSRRPTSRPRCARSSTSGRTSTSSSRTSRARPGGAEGHDRRRARVRRRRRRAGGRARSRTSSARPARPSTRFPLYSLDDATRLRSQVLGVFEAADRNPELVERGRAELRRRGRRRHRRRGRRRAGGHDPRHAASEFRDLAVTAAQVHVVDLGHALLAPFSDKAHDYVAKVLGRKGVRLHMGVAVTEVAPGHVTLADGTTIRSHCVIWGGGIMGPSLAAPPAAAGARRAHRRPARPDGRRRARRLRRRRRGEHPQPRRAHAPAARLGGDAERPAAAENVLADFAGKPRRASTTTTRGSWP